MKLEVGKKYMRRDGTGPVEITRDHGSFYNYRFEDTSGKYYPSCGGGELVSEWGEPVKQPVKYNEGDLVTIPLTKLGASLLSGKHYSWFYENEIVDHKSAPFDWSTVKRGQAFKHIEYGGIGLYVAESLYDKNYMVLDINKGEYRAYKKSEYVRAPECDLKVQS